MTSAPRHRFNIWDLADKPAAPTPPRTAPSPTSNVGISPVGQSSPAPDDYNPSLPTQMEFLGFCALPGQASAPCKTVTVCDSEISLVYRSVRSPAQTAALGPQADQGLLLASQNRNALTTGSEVTLDLDNLGKISGSVIRSTPNGFEFAVPRAFQQTLRGSLLKYVLSRKPEKSIVPNRTACTFTTGAGEKKKARIINITPTKALLSTTLWPKKDEQIFFDGPDHLIAVVTRVFEAGFAVSFETPIPDERFSPEITLIDV